MEGVRETSPSRPPFCSSIPLFPPVIDDMRHLTPSMLPLSFPSGASICVVTMLPDSSDTCSLDGNPWIGR